MRLYLVHFNMLLSVWGYLKRTRNILSYISQEERGTLYERYLRYFQTNNSDTDKPVEIQASLIRDTETTAEMCIICLLEFDKGQKYENEHEIITENDNSN